MSYRAFGVTAIGGGRGHVRERRRVSEAMEPLPQLESCLRLAFDAGDAQHPSGVSLASWFVRAPTRGRRRSEIDASLLFPPELRARLGAEADRAVDLAMDPASWRSCPSPRPAVPLATREWLASAALALGKAEGFAVTWALLRAVAELESVAQRLLGSRTSRATVRQVLHGVGQRALRVEPFAAFVVRVLKIAQAAYAAFRHAGNLHGAAWRAVEDRLWLPHPTGRSTRSGVEVRGAYLPSLLQAAAGNARKRLRRRADEHRTQEHARALLARFAAGPGRRRWPARASSRCSRKPRTSGAPGAALPAGSPLPWPMRDSGPPNGCPTGPTISPSGS